MSLRTRFLATISLAAVIATSSALTGGVTARARPIGAARTAAAHLCVKAKAGCFSTIQAAVDAAHDGDTIQIGAGTFTGGVTVDVSVKFVGAGATATVIDGGGPVLTIGLPGAVDEPTVSVEGVTITGGNTVGNLLPWRGKGGGVYIPRADGPSPGATVTIRNSIIRGNTVSPGEELPIDPCCPFADASGGGISNDGDLTLDHTAVSDNLSSPAGGLTSDAEGGGIINRAFGTLTLMHSSVSGNRAIAMPPNGRFADGGGILAIGGQITIVDSSITNNVARLTSSFGNDVDQAAIAGGLHVTENASATIRGTTISGNSLSASNSVGGANAFSGGLHTDGPLDLRDSEISHNSVVATAGPGSSGDANVDSGAGEINTDATIRNTRFTGNSAAAAAASGDATAAAGAIVTAGFDALTLRDSVVSGNSAAATSATGLATASGGGLANIGVLTLRNTHVSDNAASADGPAGVARGGGIANGPAPPDGPPNVLLTLLDSRITHNAVTASDGVVTQGGGLFTLFPTVFKNSAVAQNAPDDCFGC